MAETDTEQELDLTEGSDRHRDVVSRHRPDRIESVEEQDRSITFVTENQVELIIRLVTPEIFQLTYYLEGDVRSDFSYAIDPEFESPEFNYSVKQEDKHYVIETSSLRATVSKEKLLVDFYDKDGNVLCEDEDGFYRRESLMKGISELKVTKKAPRGVRYFGLGDKAVDVDLRGRAYENWNTDSYAYERGEDPLYRSIPFYLALIEDRAYGIFLDNTYRTRFSFDRQKDRVSSFNARGGVMNYYFIYGPKLKEVTERYTKLTGTPEMPPMWALGYHQCRWSYYPEARVRELADTFREKKIPCDAIYLDIDYMDEYRVFTWNKKLFPDAKKMISDLREQGFRTIVMIDPGVKMDKDYFVFQEGMDQDFFCKRPDGETVIAPVWPSKCVFPDFTQPDVRDWWADLYKPLVDDLEMGGIWNDMNEPAVFEVKRKTFPNDIRHDYDGHPCSHKKAHNIYGMQMARASLKGIKKHAPDRRPFLLTRANFSGGQRYAALWTGDNIATWDHLRLANEQCQRLSISGYSFVGSDVGGFVKKPDGELLARWMQLSVFHPLFRNHSMGYNVDGAAAVKKDQVELQKRNTENDQEPWCFGKKFTEINREAVNLRYRLLNYLYTAFYSYINEGTPVLKPLAYEDQGDSTAAMQNDAFLFGDDILVSPVVSKDKTVVTTYLPKGKWYHYWDDMIFEGGKTYDISAPLERIPFFVREGTVLPLREVMQYTDEKDPDVLELNVYHSASSKTSRLYEDGEEGWDYKNGEYRLTNFSYDPDEINQKTVLSASREGSYEPGYESVEITFIGLPFKPATANVDGKEKDVEIDDSETVKVCRVNVASGFEEIILS
ncbi:glycoside hydrolase family 31 protein [Balneolaceae bacterium YR4-1]|uniref:Glycoside hydrolase family 31 protein n=1 Tax=Halalkalibaculum roseum TaxID=2709311 RepID=A0A6M1T4S0_9BACT|nr:glycoside hydrolase family 31 protein [Halalkalibaculum roseum]NGP75353.1 glycoside hydrolase family 31 protein [Halalkalibaculum roseum]